MGEKNTEKAEILNFFNGTKATWAVNKWSHVVKAKYENFLEETVVFLPTQIELRILIF